MPQYNIKFKTTKKPTYIYIYIYMLHTRVAEKRKAEVIGVERQYTHN